MKRFIIILSALLLVGYVSAQSADSERAKGKERVEQQVRHYIALFSLSEEEAQAFSDLYKEYTKKMYAIHVLYKQDDNDDNGPLTDEQIDRQLLNNFAQSRAILDVREQFYRKFRKVLTPSQINTILEDERARRARAIAGSQQR